LSCAKQFQLKRSTGTMADDPKPPAPAAPKPPTKPAAEGGAAKAEHKPPAAAAPVAPADPPPPANIAVPAFITERQSVLPGTVTQLSYWVGDWALIVPVDRLLDVAGHLRAGGFDFCSDVTASDWPQRPQRFDVVYMLYSIRDRQRIRLKVRAGE